MAKPIDLGQCVLCDAASGLQLRFMAEAAFKLAGPTGVAEKSDISLSLSELQSRYWIREAPQLVLSFLIRLNTGAAVSSIASTMKTAISLSSVWSDLGFEIRPSENNDPMSLGQLSEYRLEFILIRSNNNNVPHSRGLPSILQNPPDAFPPPDVPAATLTHVYIQLGYSYSPSQLQDDELFAYFDSPKDINHPFNEPDDSTKSMLSLLDIGLQKLIPGSTSKSLHIPVEEDALASLAACGPSIFKKGYLHAMNQRALLIPKIADAMASVLGSTSSQKSNFEASLWRVAQTGLLKASTPKRKTTFLADVSMGGADSDMIDMGMDQEDFSLCEPAPKSDNESDGRLFASWSEASFELISQSPETTQDSLSLDDFPVIVPRMDPVAADDMLFSDS